jgi:hypothetical protein
MHGDGIVPQSFLREAFGIERRKAFVGHSTRLSSVDGATPGLIVVNINGEGRGVACRVVIPLKAG